MAKPGAEPIETLARELAAVGSNLCVEEPDGRRTEIGTNPQAARAVFRSTSAMRALERRDHLAIAEAFMRGEIDVEGDWREIMRVTEVIRPDPGWWERLWLGAQLLLRSRRALQRESIAFHYDRPPDFFLPWFERWRSYSHGLYQTPDDDPSCAQERKLAHAVAALRVAPGDVVFDMGCGWGSFLEYAGRLGIQVHGITVSHEQERFVRELIARESLPCRVDRVDFLDFRPEGRFDGAVFMGTFEHFVDYRHAVRFLDRHLAPDARVWADFCSDQEPSHQAGAFLARHIWPGTATYVDVPRLLAAFQERQFHIHQLVDDTSSYALTVRDWADSFDRAWDELSARFDNAQLRAFQLFLRASQYFLEQGRTQAYHLVAGRRPAALRQH